MAQLSTDYLKKVGAFTGAPIKKNITWELSTGETVEADTYIRPIGYQTARADLTAITNKTDAIAERIAAHICDEKGDPVFTYADIVGTAEKDRGGIDAPLVMALLVAINEVTSLGKTTKSPPKTSSSVS